VTGTALVTGGSAGLGEALVRQLRARGFRVVCIDIVAPERTDGVLFVKCDLADRRAVSVAWPAIIAAAPFDLVVFNAGVNATGPFETIPDDVYTRMVTVNTETPIRLAAALMRETAVRSGGHLVFVSSLAHFTGYPGAAVYAASKDAIAVYAGSARAAYRKRGVSITCVYPGPLRTQQAARHAPAGTDAARRMPATDAAMIILAGTLDRKKTIIPGFTAGLVALAGRLFPAAVTRWMRREIFLKLGGTVY
jgi:short-subunit dehydrogenase